MSKYSKILYFPSEYIEDNSILSYIAILIL